MNNIAVYERAGKKKRQMSNEPLPKEAMAVIFLHLPKSGGMTLHSILERQYLRDAIYHIDALNRQESLDELKNMSFDSKKRLRCIKGHMPFGLHEYLPQPVIYITLVRNPLERMISEYNYILRSMQHPMHSDLVSENDSFEKYVNLLVKNHEINLQTRWLSGFVPWDKIMPPYDPLPDKALEIAKSNVKSFFGVCGVTESFDKSLLLMKQFFGWKHVFYTKKNVTKRGLSPDRVPKHLIQLIEEHTRYDVDLYQFVVRRLETMLKGKEGWLAKEMLLLRVKNILYRGYQGATFMMKHALT